MEPCPPKWPFLRQVATGDGAEPHSDIDLMFLYPLKAGGKAFEKFQELVAEEILYPLWDLGLKVGTPRAMPRR